MIVELRREIQRAKDRLETVNAERDSLKINLGHAQDGLKSLDDAKKKEVATAKAEMPKLQARIAELTRLEVAARRERDTLKEQVDRTTTTADELAPLRAQLTARTEELQRAADTAANLQAERRPGARPTRRAGSSLRSDRHRASVPRRRTPAN